MPLFIYNYSKYTIKQQEKLAQVVEEDFDDGDIS
jgi:hypothetical protein